MTSYNLQPSRFTNAADLQKSIGQVYHLGLSDGVVFYGYILEPNASKDGGFAQQSDITGRDTLIQTASPNIIDRYLVSFPRVTDGDFSGGGYQEVFIDPKRYFDSDLDPRVPGYLQLRSQWARVTKPGITVGGHFQVVPFNGDFWFTFGEANGNVYSANGGATGTPTAASVISLDTDGSLLYAGTAGGLWSSPDGATWTAITSAINGTALQWWVVNQGTNGFFAYYQTGPNKLYKIDLTLASPQGAAAQPQVPVGNNALNIVDLVEYQTSIAILTVDVRGPGFDVWYFDGNNLTRITRVEGYVAQGICQALGSLYVSASAVGGATSPILAKIDSGNYDIVARPGSPFPTAGQSCMQPRAASQYVYWPIIKPSINGISGANGVIVQYDVLSGAVTHLPNQDGTDFTATGGSLRAIALLGDNAAGCFAVGTTGTLQYQLPAFGTVKYQPSGWIAASHIDFDTPALVKRFRRIEAHHAPLNAGEQILVEAFVDLDPLGFSTSLPPSPASATSGQNTVVGSTLTAMTFGQDTIGKSLYFASQLTAGTGGNTTPRVSYYSIEVGGVWAWPLTLACTSKRRLLQSEEEETQPTGHDLNGLLAQAYENGTNLTFYHRNGTAYTVAIDSYKAWNPSPMLAAAPQEIRDEEWIVAVTLRQVL